MKNKLSIYLIKEQVTDINSKSFLFLDCFDFQAPIGIKVKIAFLNPEFLQERIKETVEVVGVVINLTAKLVQIVQ